MTHYTSHDIENPIEKELQNLVSKWTEHMKWRSDYDRWVEERIWQEKKSTMEN